MSNSYPQFGRVTKSSTVISTAFKNCMSQKLQTNIGLQFTTYDRWKFVCYVYFSLGRATHSGTRDVMNKISVVNDVHVQTLPNSLHQLSNSHGITYI